MVMCDATLSIHFRHSSYIYSFVDLGFVVGGDKSALDGFGPALQVSKTSLCRERRESDDAPAC